MPHTPDCPARVVTEARKRLSSTATLSAQLGSARLGSAQLHGESGTSSDTARLSGKARSVISCGRARSCGVSDQCTHTTSNAEYAEKRNSSSPCTQRTYTIQRAPVHDASMRRATVRRLSMDLACASEPNAYEGCAIIAPSDLDVRRLDKVDIVAATHEVELNPPQHARVDRIGKDHLNPMRS